MSRLSLKLGLLAGSLAFCLVAAETATRLVRQPTPYRRDPQVLYEPHPVRTFTLKPCQNDVYTLAAKARVDCRGFRSNGQPPRGGETDHQLRIFALGDSFTFGMGVADDETWPARLEQGLAERLERPVTVINAGTISYGVFQQMDLLRQHLAQTRPDIVIHALYWNDYQSAHPPPTQAEPVLTREGEFVWEATPEDAGTLLRSRRWLTGHSALLSLVRDLVRSTDKAEETSAYAAEHQKLLRGAIDPANLEPIRDFYVELSRLRDEHGFGLFVIVLPVADLVINGVDLENPYRLWVSEVLQEQGIQHLDAFELWEDQGLGAELFLPQGPDAHLNARGYRLIAQGVTDWLVNSHHREPLTARR